MEDRQERQIKSGGQAGRIGDGREGGRLSPVPKEEANGSQAATGPGPRGILGGAPDTADHLRACAYKIAQQVVSSLDLDDLFQGIACDVVRALSVDYCEILELEERGQFLILRAGHGFPDELVGSARVGLNLESHAGYTLLRDEPVVVTDLADEERFDVPGLLKDQGAVSGITVPIRPDPATKPATDPATIPEKGAYGVLGVYCTSAREFSAEEVGFLVDVARIIAGAYARRDRDRAFRKELQAACERAGRLEDQLAFDTEVLETLTSVPFSTESSHYQSVAECAAHLAVPHLGDWCMIDLLEDPLEKPQAESDGTNDGTRLGKLVRLDARGERKDGATGVSGTSEKSTLRARPDRPETWARTRLSGWWRVRRAAVGHPSGDHEARVADRLTGPYPIDVTSRYGTPKVLRSGRTQHLPEVDDAMLEELADDGDALETLRALGARSYIGVPLKANDRKIGVIAFLRTSRSPSESDADQYGPEDVERAERYALIVSNALTSRAVTRALEDGAGDGAGDGADDGVQDANGVDDKPDDSSSDGDSARETWGGSDSDVSGAGDVSFPWEASPGPKAFDVDPLEILTENQARVYELVGRGMSNRQIADELFLSPSTIRSQVQRCCVNLGITHGGRQELLRHAIRYLRTRS